MVRWHRDVDAEYGDCSFICTILFAEPAAEDMGPEAPKRPNLCDLRGPATGWSSLTLRVTEVFTEKGV